MDPEPARRIQELEAAVRESENRYRMLLEQATDGILICDAQGRLLEANDVACAMLGYPREALLQRRVPDVIVPDAERDTLDPIALQAGKTTRAERLARRQDGTIFPVEVSAKLLEGGRVQGVMRDMTARKQFEERLRAGERLEALGRVAAGVAHEFNNILAGIVGRLDLLALEVQDPAQAATLSAIQQTVDEGARLVRRIQTFARFRNHEASGPVPLSDLVNGALAQTRSRWHNGAPPGGAAIALQTELEHGLVVAGNAVELREALANLILNAVDALPEGGQIVIRTERQGNEALLIVRDTGMGIDPAAQARIFEPFFSTKVTGSGLGLAAVKDIVQEHGGGVSVVSQPGMGSVFTVRLPLLAPDAGEAGPAAGMAGLIPAALEPPPAAPAPAPPAGAPAPPALDLPGLIHDLRGPLTYLVGYAELLHTRDLPPASVQEMAGELLRQAERLREIVDALRPAADDRR